MTIISKLMSKALVMGLTIGSVLVMGWEPKGCRSGSSSIARPFGKFSKMRLGATRSLESSTQNATRGTASM